ncbi:MAG: hypothetical protein KAI79_07825 [Bacteroidales bacterium]|nr:hypothetical protein [Bacteroidales bacterium]
MKKKYYIPLLFAGTLLVFSILPFLNYSTDQRRVLHSDYSNAYEGITINKPFLKVSYLLNHKDKYDTLLMGSSRNASLDVNLVSQHAYNLYYEFGMVGAHLHNLKILLANKVKIKNVWLGINDYDTWKNPKDHERDYSKKTYKDNFIDKVGFYSFYLFKKIDDNDIEILRGKNHLSESNRIIQKKDIVYEKKLKDKEQRHVDNSASWIKKMTSTAGMILGYQDNEYRIDDTVKEIKELKELCKKHNITLTVFMYPSFYKTYLQYNQYKIEEFKRKLSSVVNFHDFYSLDQISLNELNWTDSSHFTLKIGNYLIKNIQQNNFLVTKDNIDSRIMETRKSFNNIMNKYVPIKYIQKFNAHMDLKSLNPIFDLKNSKYKFYKNDQVELKKDNDSISFTAKNSDPVLILNKTQSNSEHVILNSKIESNKRTIFQIYYKKTDQSEYNEKDAFRVYLKKGLNEFNLLIPSEYLNNELRIDLVSDIGIYTLKEFSIYGLE